MRVIKHDQCITHFHSVVCRPLSAPGPRPEPCDGWCRPRVPTIPGPGPEARRQSPGQQPLRPALLHYQRRLGSPDSVYWRPGLESRRAGPQPLALFQMSSRRGNRSGGGIPGGRPRDDRDQAGLWPIQTAAGFRQAAGQRRAGALSRVSICRGRVSCSKKTVAIRSRQATCKLLNRLWLIINVASCQLTRNAASSRNCAAIAGNPTIAVKYVSTRRLVAWFFLISTNR